MVQLLCFNSLSDMDFSQLLAVHEESIRLSGKDLYPFESDDRQLLLAQMDFEDYLRRDFFTQKMAQYFVLEDGGSYVSTLRIEQYKEGLLLCALETKPGSRHKGYAKRLVNAVLNYVSAPVYSHISKKNKPSISVHLSCAFRKLHDGARFLDGSVNALADTYIYTK